MFISVFFTTLFATLFNSQNVFAASTSMSFDSSEIITGDVSNQDPGQDQIHTVQDRTATQFPKGIVPYYIEVNSYDPIITERIQAAMDLIEASSCVVFKQMTFKPADLSNGTWIYFTNPDEIRECVHETGKGIYGEIIVIIGYECMLFRYIVHAVLHAIGFKDEVSHPHRDQYIRIMWENIQPSYRKIFLIQHEDAPYKLVEYDPMSIMHFHDRAFSMNGAPTIAPKVPGLLISPSEKLSQLDVMKLRLWFGHECNKRKVGLLLEKCKTVLHNNPSELGLNEERYDKSFPSVEANAENSYDRDHGDESFGLDDAGEQNRFEGDLGPDNGGREEQFEGGSGPDNGGREEQFEGGSGPDNKGGEDGFEGGSGLDNNVGEVGFEGGSGLDSNDEKDRFEGGSGLDNNDEKDGVEGGSGQDNNGGKDRFEGDSEPDNHGDEDGFENNFIDNEIYGSEDEINSRENEIDNETNADKENEVDERVFEGGDLEHGNDRGNRQ